MPQRTRWSAIQGKPIFASYQRHLAVQLHAWEQLLHETIDWPTSISFIKCPLDEVRSGMMTGFLYRIIIA